MSEATLSTGTLTDGDLVGVDNDTLRRMVVALHDRALRAEAAVPVWVPTVERLPALHEDVLIAWHYSGHPRVDAAFLTDGNDWITGDMVVATHDVTHWMPAPAHPGKADA